MNNNEPLIIIDGTDYPWKCLPFPHVSNLKSQLTTRKIMIVFFSPGIIRLGLLNAGEPWDPHHWGPLKITDTSGAWNKFIIFCYLYIWFRIMYTAIYVDVAFRTNATSMSEHFLISNKKGSSVRMIPRLYIPVYSNHGDGMCESRLSEDVNMMQGSMHILLNLNKEAKYTRLT